MVADPALLETLRPDKLASSSDDGARSGSSGAPSPFADLAGVTAAVDHLAALDPAAAGTRRERLLASMAAAEAYELELFGVLLSGLEAMPHVTTYGKAARRTATAYFTVAGRTPRAGGRAPGRPRRERLERPQLRLGADRRAGIRDAGSAVRAGLVHYNDRADVDRLLDGVAELG